MGRAVRVEKRHQRRVGKVEVWGHLWNRWQWVVKFGVICGIGGSGWNRWQWVVKFGVICGIGGSG